MSGQLVLLHGFTQTGAAWKPVGDALAGAYAAILAPDLRGHGAASGARPVDLEAVLGDLDAVISDAVLAGYSMGGRLALAYALHRPDRVRRLVLIGASPGLADPAERAARRTRDEVLASRIEERGVESFAREWAGQPLFAGQSPPVAAAAHELRLGQTPEGLAAALRGLGTGTLPSLWDELPSLELPVTLMVGERDDRFRRLAVRMASRLPDARVVVVSGAGHAVHLEDPASLVAELHGPRPPMDETGRHRV